MKFDCLRQSWQYLSTTSLTIFVLLSPGACSTVVDPASYPFEQDHDSSVVEGAGFLHQLVFKQGEGERLHVYIEGDGRPWVTPLSVARDPTPKHPVMLELMAQDSAPALYLGRPCYFNTQDARCGDSRWWTSHRYSTEIVRSLGAVLDRFSDDYVGITLIGHSGGGTLSYLLAGRRQDVDMVVTLAGNLNVGLWTQEHGYSALSGSLDPADDPSLDAGIAQLHLWGERDSNVRLEVIDSVVAGQEAARVVVLEGLDHACCWGQVWPRFLQQMEQESGLDPAYQSSLRNPADIP